VKLINKLDITLLLKTIPFVIVIVEACTFNYKIGTGLFRGLPTKPKHIESEGFKSFLKQPWMTTCVESMLPSTFFNMDKLRRNQHRNCVAEVNVRCGLGNHQKGNLLTQSAKGVWLKSEKQNQTLNYWKLYPKIQLCRPRLRQKISHIPD
jgi:hypothetical protein